MSDGPQRRSWAKRWVCCLAAAAALVCAPNAILLGDGYGSNSVTGRVTGPDGHFVENIEVRLQTQSGVPADVEYTDAQGEFVFRGVRDGVYHVVIDDARYQRASVTAHVSTNIEPVQRVFLSLVARDDSPKAPAPYAAGSQTVSVDELRKRYPEKAIKEYSKGNSKLSRGDLKGAIAAFEKAVELAPEMYPALGNLGNAYLQTGRLPDAESAFQKALKADPESAESYVNLGHVYFEMHKYNEAADSLSQGMKRDPNNPLAYFFLGMTSLELGKAKEAEVNLKRALDLNEPETATAHLALANLYLKSQRNSEAREQLEEFLKARPQDAQAGHVRDVLARMKTEAPQ